MHRRTFQSQLAAACGSFATLGAIRGSVVGAEREKGARTTNPIGVSTYSLWRFKNDEFKDVRKCIDFAAECGFDGVEILLYQLSQTELLSNSALQSIKRHAFVHGLPLYGMSTHQGFVSPDPEVRRMNIELTIGQIELCYKLGIPTMRVNTGRWGTTKSFDSATSSPRIPDRKKVVSTNMARQAAKKDMKEEGMALDNSNRPAKDGSDKDEDK